MDGWIDGVMGYSIYEVVSFSFSFRQYSKECWPRMRGWEGGKGNYILLSLAQSTITRV